MQAKQLRNLQRQIEQTRTIERPGASGFDSFYATGTWTPAFAGTTVAGTFTYNGQVGFYTRIGNQVLVHGFVSISAIAVNPTGNMIITGLPFTAANVGLDFSVALGYVHNINTSANIVQLTAIVRLNSTQIWLGEEFDNAAWTQFPAANFTNAAAAIELSAVYQV